MTTLEAFKELIAKRNWYQDLDIKKEAAWSLAKRVNDGERVSIEKMEDLLEKAGFKVVQEKEWGPGVN